MSTIADPIAAAREQVVNPYQQDGNPALGPSKINTYLRCPRSYQYQYIERIKRASSPAASLGTAVHSVIEHAHRLRWTEADADAAGELMLQTWEEVRPHTSDPQDPDANKGAVAAATEWLPWYLHWTRDQQDIVLEERFELTLGDSGIQMRGTIDRVYHDGARAVLSDVKSGKRATPQGELDTDLQLTVYAWACTELGLTPDALQHCYVRLAKTAETTRSRGYVLATLQHVVEPVAAAIEASVFPCNPSPKFGCSFCDYKAHCPIGAGAGEGDAA